MNSSRPSRQIDHFSRHRQRSLCSGLGSFGPSPHRAVQKIGQTARSQVGLPTFVAPWIELVGTGDPPREMQAAKAKQFMVCGWLGLRTGFVAAIGGLPTRPN